MTAREKSPRDGAPVGAGASIADQVLPRSVEWNARAALPPVANQRSSPRMPRAELLAANAPSPGFASDQGSSCQLSPPSVVSISTNRPSMGSPSAYPRDPSAKASASKKIPGVSLRYTARQLFPPSSVRN